MSAGAAGRLRALPADATATEVLCAALGCDRRALSSWPGGAARELASMLSGGCDREALLGLASELEEGARETRDAAALIPDRPREAFLGLSYAEDFDEAAARIRGAVGEPANGLPTGARGGGAARGARRRKAAPGEVAGAARPTRRTNCTDGGEGGR